MSDVAVRSGQAVGTRPGPQTRQPPAPQADPAISVEAYDDPQDAMVAWRDLDGVAAVPPYQSPGWLVPWVDSIGSEAQVSPLIVVARSSDGTPLALLPFGLVRRRLVTVAVFLGGRDSNFNMGLFRPGVLWSREGLRDLLGRAAAASQTPVDAFVLINQPHGWDGVPNPLLKLGGQPSPSFAYGGHLLPDRDAFLRARLSRDGRRKLRQKLNRLQALGPVVVRHARSSAEIAETLDAFVEQRRARSQDIGLPTDDLGPLRAFLDVATTPIPQAPGRGADAELAAPVEFYALLCGDRVVATFGGARRGRRFSGMLLSFATDPEVARMSPGELLLSEVLKQHCDEGLDCYDLGIGEARYKSAYCPEVEALFDTVVPVTGRGRLYARIERLRLSAKRAIKQSTWAWSLVRRFRRHRPWTSGRGSTDRALVPEH